MRQQRHLIVGSDDLAAGIERLLDIADVLRDRAVPNAGAAQP
jgi:hypothetical protein